MNKVIVIVGPTASGKTALSISLAKEMNGEIVSADSMQIYKYMDIGTAKPDLEEMSGIKHYLIDEVNPDEEFSVARFKELVTKYIDEILDKGKQPIVVGGTGLYINSLLYNIDFSETVSDWELREELKKEALEMGNEYLHDKLKSVDPIAAGKIHKNDLKRIIRALEVYEYSKKTITEHQEVSRQIPSKYEFYAYGLKMDRERLYNRINQRVDIMFERGLIEEVKGLINMGYDKHSVAMQALGYKELLLYLRDEISLDDAKEIIKMGSRRYAKRQITWFKKTEGVKWIDLDLEMDINKIAKNIKNDIATNGNFL
ncbi:tRNA (adenosine(37)-N6)-dimethylallyltransferase MiaA [Pseudobacteroides cellulosolvens]|uniref:tRNA dimethylallyltransferase n=1 Tax=Pseudobacteroides cellulosolvens ATCC 35603 = DSM 2933 TaxID=398512 RepID=A0A0L6JJ39_9FIRM|nr:tRNA (adenosine(37)-N6)-dimethylallyltransferase MiaA [Pseudobacteroides cellulosolvens]KNY25759.1 tRNA dimethylallyltransferase [Pseudobacteroides cellulosolvens ATCC 35603 = DSM 2933]